MLDLDTEPASVVVHGGDSLAERKASHVATPAGW